MYQATAAARLLIQGVRRVSSRRSYATVTPTARISSSHLIVDERVDEALAAREAVVALESTILTHGMPYPQNLEMARSVERIIRKAGAVPATIALISGKVHVGLSTEQLEKVARSTGSSVKVSRRDIAYTLNSGLLGGTTISATMFLAHMVGIQVFVSGGLGGVHRGGEASLDISADLTELGRTPVALVTSGVKSILDIGRTLEYLETQGVCVATYGHDTQFPAFFTRDSGHQSVCNVSTISGAAQLINSTFSLGLGNGLLIANPIASEYEMEGRAIESSIQQAVSEASQRKICGKEITPYILQRVNELTEGRSLQANIALVESNAALGAGIAVRLCELQGTPECRSPTSNIDQRPTNPGILKLADMGCRRPTVVGASNLDCILHIQEDSVQFTGQTNKAIAKFSCGGVGRNLSDGLTRLGLNPQFLTALGDDVNGDKIVSWSDYMDWSLARRLEDMSTAFYTAVLDKTGDVLMGIGDMEIHDHISPQYIMEHVCSIRNSSLIIMDGNISVEAMRAVGEIATNYGIPVFYEPTDIDKAAKPFIAEIQDTLTFIKPNLKEFFQIYKHITGKHVDAIDLESQHLPVQLTELCSHLGIPNILITMGRRGLLCYMRRSAHNPIQSQEIDIPRNSATLNIVKNTTDEVCIQMAAQPVPNIASVSGAGDCMAVGFLTGFLRGEDIMKCLNLGSEAAKLSLQSYHTVPASIQHL